MKIFILSRAAWIGAILVASSTNAFMTMPKGGLPAEAKPLHPCYRQVPSRGSKFGMNPSLATILNGGPVLQLKSNGCFILMAADMHHKQRVPANVLGLRASNVPVSLASLHYLMQCADRNWDKRLTRLPV